MDMTSIDWSNQLGEFKILSCLNEEQLTHFLETSSEVAFNKDDVILQEGDIGKQSSLYFIGTGSVSIALSGVGKNKIPIDTLGPGEFFGEMAGLDKKPRTATVIAAENCLLRKISGEKFQSLMNQNAVFASRVATVLSERVRRLIENVLAVKLKDFDEKLVLTNTKLDASLKSVESQQKAAHAVFEGINTRANEVINSAERSRSRTTFVLSFLGVAATALTLFLSEGLSELKKEAKEALADVNEIKNELKDVPAQLKSFKELEKTAETMNFEIKKATEELKKTKLTSSFQSYTIRNIFDDLVFRTTLENLRDGNAPLLAFYRGVLERETPELTDALFKKIEGYILSPKEINKAIKLLEIGLESNSAKNNRQIALTYYYLLAANLINSDEVIYKKLLSKYEKFVQTIEPISIQDKFNPDWFKDVMQLRDIENAQSKIDKIYSVWRIIPRK